MITTKANATYDQWVQAMQDQLRADLAPTHTNLDQAVSDHTRDASELRRAYEAHCGAEWLAAVVLGG